MAKDPDTEDGPQIKNRPEQGGELPLPDPYPEYLACPHCGEPEVEIWCYQVGVFCHRCDGWIEHVPDPNCGDDSHCIKDKNQPEK